jgi:hypothetical protein
VNAADELADVRCDGQLDALELLEQLDSPEVKLRADAQPTSAAAAAKATLRAGTARRRVLALLVDVTDATDEELQRALDLGPNTQRPRRVELVEAGFVEPTELTRPTSTGSASIVWTATAAGHAALAAARST